MPSIDPTLSSSKPRVQANGLQQNYSFTCQSKAPRFELHSSISAASALYGQPLRNRHTSHMWAETSLQRPRNPVISNSAPALTRKLANAGRQGRSLKTKVH
eukprot:6188908-Pleurochrysis_carterae.AAC.3